MNYINLCPHPVRVKRVSDGGWDYYPACETPARSFGDKNFDDIRDDHIQSTIDREKSVIVNLPEQCDGVLYIVSSVIQDARPKRIDLVVPDPIKDENGKTIGAKGFIVSHEIRKLYE